MLSVLARQCEDAISPQEKLLFDDLLSRSIIQRILTSII